jgi:hypothetical protein
VATPNGLGLSARFQRFEREFAHRLQHPEARFPADDVEAAHQALLGERIHPGQHLDIRAAGDRRGRLEVEAAGEDRQPPEVRLIFVPQEVVAPGDRVAHRAQPRRVVAAPASQDRERLGESRQQRRRRQQTDLGRRQLDRQGQPIQALTNRRDGESVGLGEGEGGVGRASPGHEEAHRLILADGRWRRGRVGQRQRGDGVRLLAGEPQHCSAGGEDGEVGTGAQQIGDERCRVEDVLEVVQDQQRLPLPEELAQALLRRPRGRLPRTESLGDGRGNQDRIADRGEGNEPDAIGELGGDLLGDPDRQPRLADPARTGQGDQADAGPAEQGDDRRDLPLPADEAGERQRQVRPVPLRQRDRGDRADASGSGVRRVGHDGSCDGDGVRVHNAERAHPRQ